MSAVRPEGASSARQVAGQIPDIGSKLDLALESAGINEALGLPASLGPLLEQVLAAALAEALPKLVSSEVADVRARAESERAALEKELSKTRGALAASEARGRSKDRALALVAELGGATSPDAARVMTLNAIAEALSAKPGAARAALATKAAEGGAPVAELDGAARLAVPIAGEVIILERPSPFGAPDVDLAGRMALAAAHRIDSLQEIQRLERSSTTDDLTGLNRRGQTIKVGKHDCEVADRSGAPVSLIFVDVDHFGKLNKEVSHDFGDKVLKAVAGQLQAGIRKVDTAGRWGGEEFVIVLVGADTGAAEEIAQRLRTSVAAETAETCGRRVTLSAGVASLDDKVRDFNALVSRADGVQSQAKQGGRNRVLVAFGKGWETIGSGVGLPPETLLHSVPLRRAIEELSRGDDGAPRRLDRRLAEALLESDAFKAILASLCLSPVGRSSKAMRATAVPKSTEELDRTLKRFAAEREAAFAKGAGAAEEREFGETALALSGFLRAGLDEVRSLPRAERRERLHEVVDATERILGKAGHTRHLAEVVVPALFADPRFLQALSKKLGLDHAGLEALKTRTESAARLATLGEIEGAIGALAAPRRLSGDERGLFVERNYLRSAELVKELALGPPEVAALIADLRYKEAPSLEGQILGLLQDVAALFEHRSYRPGSGWLEPAAIEKALRANAERQGTDPELVGAVIEAIGRLDLRAPAPA